MLLDRVGGAEAEGEGWGREGDRPALAKRAAAPDRLGSVAGPGAFEVAGLEVWRNGSVSLGRAWE